MKKIILTILFIFILHLGLGYESDSNSSKPAPYARYEYKKLGEVLAVEDFKDTIVKEPCMSVIIDAGSDSLSNIRYKVYLIPIRNFHYSYEHRNNIYLYSRLKKDGSCEMEYAILNER